MMSLIVSERNSTTLATGGSHSYEESCYYATLLPHKCSDHLTGITRYADLAGTNGVATTDYTYDNSHWLTALSHEKDSSVIVDYAWMYDVAGRITSLVNVDGTDMFTHDNSGQLTQTDSDYQADESYSYDGNGNRTNTGYDTGDNNRLLSDGTYDYEYDAEGNRTKKTEISSGDYVEYAWDHRNRLVSVTYRNSSDVKTKEVAYNYDAFDRRIGKDVDDDGNGTFDRGERYVYDGSDIVLVFTDAGALTERLLYGPAVDQPLASEAGSGDVRWMLADNQGTIRDVAEYDPGTDTTSVVNHLQYGSFGIITAQTNASEEPRHTYTGREWDADAELYYYRARWYDAGVGRFISEDPIGFNGDPTNLSRYVGNSPGNFNDPSGLDAGPTGALYSEFGGPAGYAAYMEAMRNGQPANGPTGGGGPSLWDDLGLMAQHPLSAMQGGLKGWYVDGMAMLANAATFHQIDALDAYVDQMVAQNGTTYQVANVSAHVGVYAAEMAAVLYAAPVVGGWVAGQWAGLGSMQAFIPTGGAYAMADGSVVAAGVVVSGQHVTVAMVAYAGMYFATRPGPPDSGGSQPYGGPDSAKNLIDLTRKMLDAARQMGDGDLAAQIAKQLELMELHMSKFYPDLFL